MKIRNKSYRPSTLLLASSFFVVCGLFLATSPVQNIGYAILFFLVVVIFIPSLLISILGAGGRKVSPIAKYRIGVLTVTVILLIMFRSAQSLNIVDLIILGLLSGGLLFYGGRRLN